MTDVNSKEAKSRRRRGPTPRGQFEESKLFATESETARLEAARKKTEQLRLLRLERESHD
jgi:hypothetical protein